MMPSNILILGDSHSAAPRIALRDHPERWPGFAPDIFAMPGAMLGALHLEQRSLLPNRPEVLKQMLFYNGVPDLPLAGYDAFVVVGGVSIFAMVGYLRHHRGLDFPSLQRGLDVTPISRGFLDAMLLGRLKTMPAVRLIRLLASLQQGPIFFMDTARPSLDSRTAQSAATQSDSAQAEVSQPEAMQNFLALVDQGDGPVLQQHYLRLLQQAVGEDAIYLPQPAETIVDEMFTGPEWMRNSMRMNPKADVSHGAEDMRHANPAYGALQIDAIWAALRAL